jgi:hypothetical protein
MTAASGGASTPQPLPPSPRPTKAGPGNGHHNDHEQKLKEQGDAYPSHDQRYDITMGQVQRRLLITETMPQDPHTDILPTGKHEVFVRKIERGPADDIKDIHRACVYTPDGRCRYMLHVDRAAQLWHRFSDTIAAKPTMAKAMKAGSFEEEVYRMCCRYTHHDCTAKHACTKDKWLTVPKEVQQVFLGPTAALQMEWYSSPLTVQNNTAVYNSVAMCAAETLLRHLQVWCM